MKNLIVNFLNDIKRNYKTLILAFILACGFWTVVSIQVFPTIESQIKGIAIEAQLTEYMVQNNLQIVSDIKDSVSIRIEGKRYDISGLTSSDFFASVDLSGVRSAGTFSLPISVSAKTDRHCEILENEPLAVTLMIDEIITREFPVNGTASGISLPDGYYAGDVSVSPETITLTGSASVLNRITKIEARSTFRGEITESHQTGSDIILYGSDGIPVPSDGIRFSTDNVSVNIPIYRQKELPITFSLINYPSNFDVGSLKFDIQPKSVTVAAPDNSIDNLSELNIGTIDISELQLNKNTYLTIALPEGYKNLSGNTAARIEWKTENYGTADFTVTNENIAITNQPDNFDVSLITNELLLKVIGPSERILGISASDISVTANLLGVTLHEGFQDVGVMVQIRGSRQSCWISGTYKVTINARSKQTDEPE